MMPENTSWDDWLRATFGADSDFFPVDMAAVVHGDLTPPEPEYLRRSDGHGLLYPGKIHWASAEPEYGKSWLALLAAEEQLEAGRDVVYFDYEMDPRDVARRLLLLGTPKSAVARLTYIRPPGKMPDDILKFYGVGDEHNPPLFQNVALVVFDACTNAMAADGYDPLDNVGVANWVRRAPLLAQKCGAAVLVLDHVTKDYKSRGRYAIGAQHKLAHADVALTLHNVKPFAPGATGLSGIVVKKDRPGGIRQWAAEGRKVGSLVVNAEDPDHLEGFLAAPTADGEAARKRKDKILEFAMERDEPLSKSALESANGGRGRPSREAVAKLIEDGKLMVAPGDEARKHPRYVVAEEQEDE